MPTNPAVEPDANAGQTEEMLAGGRYAVWRKIASGSQADTLEAVDRKSGCPVAVKRFSVSHAQSWKDVDLAEREIRVLSSLSHPSLPAYLDHFEERGRLYLVMELIEGQTLAALMRSGKRLGLDQLLALMRSLCDTLEYLHSRVPPVIHRDIKPANVILRPDGRFSLVDFGSVRDGLKPEGGSTVVGTFGYMAPEQFQGRALPASDVYAVGALMLALLSGKGPEQLPHQGLSIDVPAALAGAVPSNWVEALGQMVNIDPDRRPSSLRPVLALVEQTNAQPRQDNEDSTSAVDSHADDANAEPDGSFTVMLGTGFGVLPWVLLIVLRIALWFLLGVFLPTLLSVLAIVFGHGLRTAAFRVSAAGRIAQARLATLAGHLRRAEPFVLQGRHYRGPRGRTAYQGQKRYERWEARNWRKSMRVDSPGFHYGSGLEDEPGAAEELRTEHRRGGDLFPGSDGSSRDGNSKKKGHS